MNRTPIIAPNEPINDLGGAPPPHPFGQLLEPGEPLLWLVRPNPDIFRAQQAKVYLYIYSFSLAAIFLLGVWLVTPQTAALAAVAFIYFLLLTCVILTNLTGSGDEEWSITWYALTPRRLLKQFLDTDAEGGRRIVQVALTDLSRLRLRKRYVRLGTSVGTITCYTPARFVREHFTLDSIENSDEVLGLIEDARAQALAVRSSNSASDKE